MEKLDLTTLYKSYYSAKTVPELVDIEPANFLSLAGKGDPSGPMFSEKLQTLYATAYSIKFRFKALNRDFVVPKLECLWWYDEHRFNDFSMSETPANIPRSEWEYRLLIRMPEYVTENEVRKGIETVSSKKALTLAGDVEFYRMTEGKSIQMLHIGPFSTEPQSLARIAEFSEAHGLKRNGVHHEIYLSDFRKTAPEKLRTILREPVK